MKWYSGPYVERLQKQLIELCTSKNFLGGQLYDIDELKECWSKSAPEYMVNAVPEIAKYPTVSIAWAMFYGMGAAKMWDTDWETYKNTGHPYETLRDKRGYDHTDEYILQEVLSLSREEEQAVSQLAGDTAERVYGLYLHQRFEPATPEAFRGYVACLHQLYLMGMAVELKALGYRMSRVE